MIIIQKLKKMQALSLDCTWVSGELSCSYVVKGLVIIWIRLKGFTGDNLVLVGWIESCKIWELGWMP